MVGVDNQQTLTHAAAIFDDFVERGGTTFDTAYIYGGGRGEKLLGQWITSRGNRDEVVVIGKGAHAALRPRVDHPAADESLERLQTDHVDLYLMHRDNEEIPVSEFVDVLDEHFKAGPDQGVRRVELVHPAVRRGQRVRRGERQATVHTAEQPPQPRPGLRRTVEGLPARAPTTSRGRGCGTGRSPVPVVEPGARVLHRTGQAGGPLGRGTGPRFYSDENFCRLDRARELAAAKGVGRPRSHWPGCCTSVPGVPADRAPARQRGPDLTARACRWT